MRFLTREGCSVCARALDALRPAARFFRIRIEEVDVDAAGQHLRDEYGSRVPVILDARGDVIAEGVIDRWQAWKAAWGVWRP